MCETYKLCFVQEGLFWQETQDDCDNCRLVKDGNLYSNTCYLENNVSRLCKEAHKIDRLIQAGESDFFIRFYLFKFRMLISLYRARYFVQSIFHGGRESPQLELIRQWANVEEDRREKISSRTEMLNPLICPHSHKFVFARICSRML